MLVTAEPLGAAAPPAIARPALAPVLPSRRCRSLDPAWLYDHRGQELHDEWRHAPACYATRAEGRLLVDAADEVGRRLGSGATLVELGSATGRRTTLLLAALERARHFAAVDVDAGYLQQSLALLRRDWPSTAMRGIVGDLAAGAVLPPLPAAPALAFVPTLRFGRYGPDAALVLLARLRRWLPPGSRVLLGADATEDAATLLSAHDDDQGLAAAFARNLLVRLNREHACDFDLGRWRYEARWRPAQRRVEAHLVSRGAQRASVFGEVWSFGGGDSILAHVHHLHRPAPVLALARRAGWQVEQRWAEARSRVSLFLLRADDDAVPAPRSRP